MCRGHSLVAESICRTQHIATVSQGYHLEQFIIMPRSFLIKKKGKSEKRIDEIIRAFAKKDIHDNDSRPVVTEPVISAVAPFTPAMVQPIQPLAVRLCNGYIHDVLSAFPYFEPRAYSTSPIKKETPEEEARYRHTPSRDPIPAEKREIPSPTSSTLSCRSDKSSAVGSPLSPSSTGSARKPTGFQEGITVGYTYDAFFVSDGRSRKRNPLGLPDPIRQRYTCNECGKHYATSSNLSRHKQTHRSLDSQQAKKCPHCGKVYVSMPALSMHILTHNLRHECAACGKSFSRPWLLQGHMRSHSGEKPYGCAHCGKAFADRSNLRAHMQTHSAFKHYKCKRCDKSFALKSYLNKHYESACLKDDGIIDVVA